MAQIQYAFIIVAPGYEAAAHHATFESSEFKSRLVADCCLDRGGWSGRRRS